MPIALCFSAHRERCSPILPDETSGCGAQAEAFAGFRGKWNLSFWIFQTHLKVHGLLHRIFPHLFADPNLVPMMTIQRSSYSTIYNRIKRPFFVILISAIIAFLAVTSKLVKKLITAV
jgi:hypothetical protein